MKTNPLLLLGAAAAALQLCGCASIVDGGDKSVRFNTTPPGASVVIVDKKGKEVCTQTTPAIVSLRRNHGVFQKEDYRIKIEHPGYYPAELHVKSVLDGWYLGNFIFGGLLGILIVDPATGAMYTLSPRDVTLNLVPVDTAITTAEQIAAAQLKANPPKVYKPATSGKGFAR